MEINVKKSKIIETSRDKKLVKILVGNKKLEQIDHIKYLGSILTNKGKCTQEISASISQAKVAFNK